MTGPIEIVATLMTLVCVVLTARQHIWCWPTGLVAVILYGWIFFEAKLYSDFGLQIVYVFMQLYGWYHWLYGGRNRDGLPVTRQSVPQNVGWVGLALVATLGLGYLMASRTDASLPFADAFTTVTALIAQWLLARKKLESWLFWIVIDVVCVRNYWVKDLTVTTGLYAILLVLAVVGYFTWRSALVSQATADSLVEPP